MALGEIPNALGVHEVSANVDRLELPSHSGVHAGPVYRRQTESSASGASQRSAPKGALRVTRHPHPLPGSAGTLSGPPSPPPEVPASAGAHTPTHGVTLTMLDTVPTAPV